MAEYSYLDDLDNLLDDPLSDFDGVRTEPVRAKKSATQSKKMESRQPLANSEPSTPSTSSSDQLAAAGAWANAMESASQALQDSSVLVQQATQKNIELAQSQQDNIKELSDAASGWRHATRQAVQEVNETKKNIIILTVISAVIAIAGVGTSVGIMLQSRSGIVSLSNAALENIDEHQLLLSKSLTLKLDEFASTMEQMQSSIEQLRVAQPKMSNLNAVNEATAIEQPMSVSANQVVSNPDQATTHVIKVEAVATKTAESQPTANIAATAPIVAEKPVITAETWQQLQLQVDQLTKQLAFLQTTSVSQFEEQTKQWQQLANQVDEKLANRLAKLPAPVAIQQTVEPAKPSVPNVVTTAPAVDIKPIMDQLARLRQDLAELRTLQHNLQEQVGQVKQSVNESANKPYQYRLPQDMERYPR